ncbi:MAG: ABC transporter substrate-binding protein [Cyanobacteria bacterium P01_E01_bin.45]
MLKLNPFFPACALAMSVAIVGCGGSPPTTTTTPTPEPEPEVAAAPSDEPIQIGYSAWPGWFPWKVAEEQGLFEANGVNVEMVWFDGYLDSITALAVGQLDGNTQTLNDTIFSVSGGSDQVIVLNNDYSTGNDAIIVDGSIGSIEDLAGKSIAAEEGVVDHFLLLLGLETVGLSQADIDFKPLETGAAAAAFAAGQLDGVGVFAPFTTQALERPDSKVLFDSSDFPGAISDHLALSRELVESRPDDVQAIVQTWYDTLDYIEENPEEAIAIMAERAGTSVEDYESYSEGTTILSLEEGLAAFEPGDDISSLVFTAEEINDFLLESGLSEEAPDLSNLFDSSFVEAVAEQ